MFNVIFLYFFLDKFLICHQLNYDYLFYYLINEHENCNPYKKLINHHPFYLVLSWTLLYRFMISHLDELHRVYIDTIITNGLGCYMLKRSYYNFDL